MGALAATAMVGASAGLVTGNRQLGANLVGTYGPDISLSLLGIDVEIDGEHNVWDHRPAVFMFNHQSSLDLLVLGTVIKRDVTGVAKKEAANDPRFIPIGALLDVAYIDRSNTAKAKAALQPAVDKLKNGVSIVIAPEGTRSATPKLGAFKKGAFHLAMQAGVPIVPVVIHNAGERMWRNSLVAHRARSTFRFSTRSPPLTGNSTTSIPTSRKSAHSSTQHSLPGIAERPEQTHRARCSRANASACASIEDRSCRVRAFWVLISRTAWPVKPVAARCRQISAHGCDP